MLMGGGFVDQDPFVAARGTAYILMAFPDLEALPVSLLQSRIPPLRIFCH
jgi:hypothetical protein